MEFKSWKNECSYSYKEGTERTVSHSIESNPIMPIEDNHLSIQCGMKFVQ